MSLHADVVVPRYLDDRGVAAGSGVAVAGPVGVDDYSWHCSSSRSCLARGGRLLLLGVRRPPLFLQEGIPEGVVYLFEILGGSVELPPFVWLVNLQCGVVPEVQAGGFPRCVGPGLSSVLTFLTTGMTFSNCHGRSSGYSSHPGVGGYLNPSYFIWRWQLSIPAPAGLLQGSCFHIPVSATFPHANILSPSPIRSGGDPASCGVVGGALPMVLFALRVILCLSLEDSCLSIPADAVLSWAPVSSCSSSFSPPVLHFPYVLSRWCPTAVSGRTPCISPFSGIPPRLPSPTGGRGRPDPPGDVPSRCSSGIRP